MTYLDDIFMYALRIMVWKLEEKGLIGQNNILMGRTDLNGINYMG